ncbi:MAG: hypothetical protein VB025_10295 [Sphaerochaeta sp.]|jgi:4-hydroxy-2-oxovalerate aldolase|nr:hypothetical protein [Sphaerochaeta sp.]PKL27733.1 MAG: 4-hydroxy-2-oxovalerate aldolase [Spirochaetae bacterium HGW-Spirochaetae-2]
MFLLDCTLRDGANVIGKGFSAAMTVSMIKGLIDNNIKVIEMGNCLGVGAYEANDSISPLNDVEYMDLVAPYLDKAEIGMFMGYKNANGRNIGLTAEKGLHFLRVGANAGDGKLASDAVRQVKAANLKCRYSMMKGYILGPKELAAEAKMLEGCGLDEITIMDSAGTMFPEQVYEYVSEMVMSIKIPVGFHGHNNLSLSMANAIAADAAGASVLDCGLMGMARSAGNLATEVAVATFQRMGKLTDIDLYGLLHYIDNDLIPAMNEYGYKTAITPEDLVYGYAGCHSSFANMFETVAKEQQVDLYKLIVEVSKIDQKAPPKELLEKVAKLIK